MLLVSLIIALVLRLVNINQSLWLDEAININIVKSIDFQTLIFKYSLGDFHPPLYHLLLKSWFLIVEKVPLPIWEMTFRLPSVLFGVATVYVAYLIGKKLFEERTALTLALLLATAPLHIYYSQEARMYSMAAFFATLSVYFFISITKKDKLTYWLGFIIATTLMLYTDYLPYLLLPTYVIYLIWARKAIANGTIKALLPALLIIAVLITPWLLILPKQLSVGLSAAATSPAWANVVGGPDLKSLTIAFVKFTIGRISIGNNLIYAITVAPIALFVGLLFLFSVLRTNTKRSFLYFWFFLPITFSYVAAFFVPIFAYFRLLFVLPAFYLILSSGINILSHIRLKRILLSITLAINLVCVAVYFLNPAFQREDWKNAVKFVSHRSDNKTVVLFESNYTMAPYDYYNQEGIEGHGALDSFDASTSDIKSKVKTYTQGKNKVYLFQYLSGITDPQGLLFKEISLLGFNNSKTQDFHGVGFVYEFTK